MAERTHELLQLRPDLWVDPGQVIEVEAVGHHEGVHVRMHGGRLHWVDNHPGLTKLQTQSRLVKLINDARRRQADCAP